MVINPLLTQLNIHHLKKAKSLAKHFQIYFVLRGKVYLVPVPYWIPKDKECVIYSEIQHIIHLLLGEPKTIIKIDKNSDLLLEEKPVFQFRQSQPSSSSD